MAKQQGAVAEAVALFLPGAEVLVLFRLVLAAEDPSHHLGVETVQPFHLKEAVVLRVVKEEAAAQRSKKASRRRSSGWMTLCLVSPVWRKQTMWPMTQGTRRLKT